MSFTQIPEHADAIQLLQRSLERGRLGHAYLICGNRLEQLEVVARTLAKTLNCERVARRTAGPPDSCDQCASCRKIDGANHPDVTWVRPESKMRVITIDQMAAAATTRKNTAWNIFRRCCKASPLSRATVAKAVSSFPASSPEWMMAL